MSDTLATDYQFLKILPKELVIQIYGSFLASVFLEFLAQNDLRDVIDPNKDYTVPEALELLKKKYPNYLTDLGRLFVTKQHELENALAEAVKE